MPSARTRNLLSWLAYGAVMLAFFAVVYNIYRDHHKLQFSDAYDYLAGLRAFRVGGDAYGVAPGATSTGFIYPPVILETAAAIRRILPGVLVWRLYLGVVFVSVLATPWLLTRILVQRQWFTPFVAALLFFLEPNLLSIYATLGANLNVVLYCLLLAGLAWSLRNKRWIALYVAIFLTALVKPPFLAFLLLPLLAGEGQVLLSAITTLAVAVAYGLQRLITPDLYASFRESVYTELILHRDYGLGIFCLIHEHTYTRFAIMQWTGSLLAHALVIAVLLACLWRIRRFRTQPGLSELWLPALLVTVVLANPRPLGYDHYVGWIFGVFLIVEWLRTAGSMAVRLGGGVFVLVVEAFFYREDPDMFYAGLLFAALVLMFARAWTVRTSETATAISATV